MRLETENWMVLFPATGHIYFESTNGRLFENNKITVLNIMQKILKVPQTLNIFKNIENFGISRQKFPMSNKK